VRQFRVHIGHCQRCGRRVQGRHPVQTSDALGAAKSQVGPDAQAAATVLHTQRGLSHGKVAAVFDTLFGIDLRRGASAQINLRAAARLEPDYRRIRDEVRSSERIAADETGWRVGGRPAWLRVWVGDQATAYGVDRRRSAAVLEQVIGRDWEGLLSHDGFASYDRFTEAIHQPCGEHILRRAREMLEWATRGAVHFPRQVIALFTEAIPLRNECVRGAVPAEEVATQREAFDDRLLELAGRSRRVAEHERLAKQLWKYAEQWFGFLSDPTVEATNWQAEQAIRPAVVNRKVYGGQPHRGRGARPRRVAVGVGDVPPAGSFGSGPCQPNPPGGRQSPPAPAPTAPGSLNKYRRGLAPNDKFGGGAMWWALVSLLALVAFVGYAVLLNMGPTKCPSYRRINVFRRTRTGRRRDGRDDEGDLRCRSTQYVCGCCGGRYWLEWDDFKGCRVSSSDAADAEPGTAPDRGGRWRLPGSTHLPGRAPPASCEPVRVGKAFEALIKYTRRSNTKR
jgi:hypothetical protein